MEEGNPKAESHLSRYLKFLLKIGVTIICFWYLSRKIDFPAAKDAFLRANWYWLFLAVILLLLSKLFSAFRLNIYFRNINVRLSQWANIKLYLLGMFYNLFLPGSISGDAYKVVLLKRKANAPYKKTSAAVLLDRFSGLLALGLIMSVYGIFVLSDLFYQVALVAGSLFSVLVLYVVIRFYFKDFLQGFWTTFLWAILVQVTQVTCVYAIILSLHLPLNQPQWLFIFLLAAVVAVFPVSLGGGLGTREVVFVEGAKYFHLDPQLGLVISLLFYLCTVLSSIGGLIYVFRDPVKDGIK